MQYNFPLKKDNLFNLWIAFQFNQEFIDSSEIQGATSALEAL
jgi:hypothetical protein